MDKRVKEMIRSKKTEKMGFSDFLLLKHKKNRIKKADNETHHFN